jgi:hypothetical protein
MRVDARFDRACRPPRQRNRDTPRGSLHDRPRDRPEPLDSEGRLIQNTQTTRPRSISSTSGLDTSRVATRSPSATREFSSATSPNRSAICATENARSGPIRTAHAIRPTDRTVPGTADSASASSSPTTTSTGAIPFLTTSRGFATPRPAPSSIPFSLGGGGGTTTWSAGVGRRVACWVWHRRQLHQSPRCRLSTDGCPPRPVNARRGRGSPLSGGGRRRLAHDQLGFQLDVQRLHPLVLQGIFLVIVMTVLVASLLADLVYVFADPRARSGAID